MSLCRLNTDNLPPLLPAAPSTHNSVTASPCLWHCRSQQLLGLQKELLLHYVRRITLLWTDPQWRNVTIRRVLICWTTTCAAWLNEFYGWIKHGPSVDQFFRLLHSPLFLNGPGYPSPWGCPRWIPILLGRRMCKAHPKTYRAAFLKCLALRAPKVCHLFSLFKRLSSLKSTVERKPLFP